MFFSSQLVNSLKEDHDLIRTYLLGVRDVDLQLSTRQLALGELSRVVRSHVEREEKVVYSFMRSVPELKEQAEEASEEHDVAEYLLNQLERPMSESTWVAKVKVFSEILERHLDEEEAHMFSKLKRHLDSDLDEDLNRRFMDGRVQPKTLEGEFIPEPYPLVSGDAWVNWINRF